MALRRSILIVLFLAWASYAAVYVVNGRDVQNRGGCWMVRSRAAFTPTMGVSSAVSKIEATTLFSLNYYTLVVVDTARDSVYTLGLDSLGLFPDSAVSGVGWTGADTTCLKLDGFVDEAIDVVFFMEQASSCTMFVTVEQAFRYDTTLADSGFNYGFFRTDTLFLDSVSYDYDGDLTNESFDVGSLSTTDRGSQARIYRDSFTLIAPCLRLKIVNSGLAGNNPLSGIGIELYPRHNNTIMSGTSGRLLEMKASPTPSNYNTNLRDR